MKKLAALILTLAMVFAMALPAFADDVSPENSTTAKTATQDVTGLYNAGAVTAPGHVYKVTVTWTITPGSSTGQSSEYTWNTDTLKYDVAHATSSSDTAPHVNVEIKNRSNDSLTLKLEYADDTDQAANTSATFTEQTVSTAAIKDSTVFGYTSTDTGTEQTATFDSDITVDDVTKLPATEGKIGTLTLTVTPANSTLSE